MDTRLLKSILVIIALVTAAPVFAQDVAVEVNLGVLKDYEPPPMFDGAPATPNDILNPEIIPLSDRPPLPPSININPGRHDTGVINLNPGLEVTQKQFIQNFDRAAELKVGTSVGENGISRPSITNFATGTSHQRTGA